MTRDTPNKNAALGQEVPGATPATADDGLADAAGAYSPLWMVTTEPVLNAFVLELQQLRVELLRATAERHVIRFSRARLAQVRAAFAAMIRHGEAQLHQLSQLICEQFLASFQLQSVVIGEVEATAERFTLTQTISIADLYSTTDLDLGTRQLNKLRFAHGAGWSRTRLVANVVDYQPTEPNPLAIHRVTTRIKAEEEIWNKVVDELFELDRLVVRDKQLRHLSMYVKDIFGIKIVVGDVPDAYKVYDALANLQLDEQALERAHVLPDSATRRLEIVEVKDYLAQGESKRSGWAAVKAIVRWGEKTFEIQIQPLRTFLHERERLTTESHLSFKAQREQVREQVAAQIPLFRFYGNLLRWLFLTPDAPPPEYAGVTILLDD